MSLQLWSRTLQIVDDAKSDAQTRSRHCWCRYEVLVMIY